MATDCFQIYGADQMKPNHHWSVHVPDQLDDFGPVYNFWAFLTERLNKILKDLNSNNWTGGELEVSMMREFHRNAALDSKVCFRRSRKSIFSHFNIAIPDIDSNHRLRTRSGIKVC